MIKVLSFNGAFCGRPTNPSEECNWDVGGGRMVAMVRGCGKLCSQTSGNASISSDMMRTVMDGSYALFGN